MARIGGRQRSAAGEQAGSSLYVQSLAHGLAILSLFDVEHPVWSLGDITKQSGLSKTTAYRMLRTLERAGFVPFDPGSECYNIGPATIPLAYLTVSHVDTSHPFKPNLPLGRVLRNLANSCMKIFAAHQSEEERERLLLGPHAALTPHTITDPALLREELRRVAEEGIAFDREEQDLGICAVSAPVFGLYGEVKAVVTVIAPAERFSPEKSVRNVEAVRAAAAELTAYLNQSTSGWDML